MSASISSLDSILRPTLFSYTIMIFLTIGIPLLSPFLILTFRKFEPGVRLSTFFSPKDVL